MADSVYRVTEVIGVSSESWEAAARSAVETAAKTVRDLRIAEVVRQDVTIEDGGDHELPRAPRDLVQVRDGGLTGAAARCAAAGPRASTIGLAALAAAVALALSAGAAAARSAGLRPDGQARRHAAG